MEWAGTMSKHDPNTCPTCRRYVNTDAYRRGVARAEAMNPVRVTGETPQ
jgi:hypothetical protein